MKLYNLVPAFTLTIFLTACKKMTIPAVSQPVNC